MLSLQEFIVKRGSQFAVVSHDRSKTLGTYGTRAAAVKRLRQIEYFKHLGETYKDRPSRPAAVKRAISRAMKGKSNFEGHSHTKKSKEEMQLKRGHDDRIQGKKWSTDRRTGKENRTYGLPDDHRWGRKHSFSRWLKGE